MKDTLSSFLPQLPGVIDTPGSQDNSSLRGLIEKPPGNVIPTKNARYLPMLIKKFPSNSYQTWEEFTYYCYSVCFD